TILRQAKRQSRARERGAACGGRWSRLRREKEPAADGDGADCGGRMARGGRLDGSGRLFGRPEASNQTARGV
ncbi:MAG: hypothetical protein IJ253_12015, partial [Bacteroidaceae bacterium]|nr:hypothetical protein [Bacteroidaceae bacterium]